MHCDQVIETPKEQQSPHIMTALPQEGILVEETYSDAIIQMMDGDSCSDSGKSSWIS
jgi:hypothetical protein